MTDFCRGCWCLRLCHYSEAHWCFVGNGLARSECSDNHRRRIIRICCNFSPHFYGAKTITLHLVHADGAIYADASHPVCPYKAPLRKCLSDSPSVSFADSSPCTEEPRRLRRLQYTQEQVLISSFALSGKPHLRRILLSSGARRKIGEREKFGYSPRKA